MKKYIFILLLGLATLVVNAQEGTTIFVNYLPSIPLGETADFSNNISPRGVDFEVNKFLNESLSVGFVVSWNLFREKIVGESFEHEDLLITGTQFRYTNLAPINVNVKKYFAGQSDYLPYLGVGVGTAYAKQTNEVGVFELSQDKWLFNVAPEIGMLYDMNYKSYLSFKIKYNYCPKAGDFPGMSYISLGIGLGLK
ncbi:MAG: OmpW family outer membrane protein [Bacteroidota bacterium]